MLPSASEKCSSAASNSVHTPLKRKKSSIPSEAASSSALLILLTELLQHWMPLEGITDVPCLECNSCIIMISTKRLFHTIGLALLLVAGIVI